MPLYIAILPDLPVPNVCADVGDDVLLLHRLGTTPDEQQAYARQALTDDEFELAYPTLPKQREGDN